ncbi:hypothetical protein ANCCAN_05629 [Ancylostoma caninum]|uniref:SXP/RAL-2 family protein Ani s 5-like cation-binding domain-containing protein n=1 Tax=Ancylostoma caninum TaxID=29170 RepID=A0A368GZB5_ANCCA|nr:hypothetical protein ANCCAN_05629 [Ancylostoma caninum]
MLRSLERNRSSRCKGFFGGYSPRYPFLRKASWEARREFNDIITNSKLTRGERESALDKWADQYGLTDAYNDYKNATNTARQERLKAILKALDDLPKFFTELDRIETSQNYTCEQERKAVRELCSTLDDSASRVADYMLFEYSTNPFSGKLKRASSFDDIFFDDLDLLKNSASSSQSWFFW